MRRWKHSVLVAVVWGQWEIAEDLQWDHHCKSAPSLLVGFLIGAGQWSSSRWSRAFPQAPTQGSVSFPWQSHHKHLWHFKSLPRPLHCLRADSEAEQSCLSQPLPKIIFQTCYYHGCAGTRSHCALAAMGRCVLWHKIFLLMWEPKWPHEPAPVPLQGSPGISLILVSDPAVLFIFQWSSLLQRSYNSTPSNL